MKKQTTKFALRLHTPLAEKLYNLSSKKNKSINKMTERLINNSMIQSAETGKIFFEFQYVDMGEKFTFKSDFENPDVLTKPIYRYNAINKTNGNFVCSESRTGRTIEFKYSEFFYKPIFIV